MNISMIISIKSNDHLSCSKLRYIWRKKYVTSILLWDHLMENLNVSVTKVLIHNCSFSFEERSHKNIKNETCQIGRKI